MKKTYYTLCLILFLCIGIKANEINSNELPIILLSNSTKFNYNEIKNLMVFGDSHSACGTNYTDMTYSGWNHSHGKNWPLYLIEFNNMKLWNFAKGGAAINKKYTKKRPDLKEQYEHFCKNMLDKKQFYNIWNGNNSLFVFCFGANDVNELNHEVFDEIVNDLFNIIDKIYNVGGRNILILGAFPIYRNPFRLTWYKHKNCTQENCDMVKNDIIIFNNIIKEKGNQFFKKYEDVNFIYYSTINIIEQIISNCNKYEFKDCINPWVQNKEKDINEFFWADSHISFKANKILAEDLNNLLNSLK